eukprot:gene5462-9691_t
MNALCLQRLLDNHPCLVVASTDRIADLTIKTVDYNGFSILNNPRKEIFRYITKTLLHSITQSFHHIQQSKIWPLPRNMKPPKTLLHNMDSSKPLSRTIYQSKSLTHNMNQSKRECPPMMLQNQSNPKN